MNKKRFSQKLKELSKKCERLYIRADAGFLTEDEKRRKCNKLAHDYLTLSRVSEKTFGPYVGAYVRHACFRIALDLKELGATPKKGRKGPDIRRKVVSNPSIKGCY